MNRRTGGVAKGVEDRAAGVVETPERTARAIWSHLLPHLDNTIVYFVYEECAGSGILSKSLMPFLPSTVESAGYILHDMSDDLICGSLFEPGAPCDVIICNPPWTTETAMRLFYSLRSKLAPGGVLFFLINNPFMYQGPERAARLGCQKFYFLPRYAFLESGKPLLDCGVAVYHNGEVPPRAASLPCYIPIERSK